MGNSIKYKGKRYSTRTFEAYLDGDSEEDSQILTIASTRLRDALGDRILDEGTDEEIIDSGIYFYVDVEHFEKDMEEICREHLDEPYVLIEEVE